MLDPMLLGLIGAGNMGSALARGLGPPLLVTDVDAPRARALAAEVGAEAVPDGRGVAARADAVVLCHKPAQLAEVAQEIGTPRAVVSILGGVPVGEVERAYPGVPVYRFIPNIPVEVRQGVLCYSPGERAGEGPEDEVLERFGVLGAIIPLPDGLVDSGMALMSCGPAFLALVVESLVDAGVLHGLQPSDAARMAVETMAGTAAVLRARDHDTAALRRRVTSPGGSTARGLAALERAGLRTAFHDAVGAVVGTGGGR
jgi:pyrroline-5-carboxylate reductase